MGFFDKLKKGLAKTKNALFSQMDSLFKSFVAIDEDMLEELEEILIAADVGVAMGNGTDIAIESADIVLSRGDLRLVSKMIDLSKATQITTLPKLSFPCASNIKEIHLNSTLKEIEDCCFAHCSSLQRIVIPSSVLSSYFILALSTK